LSTVQAANLMDGSIRIVDAKDENGAYASFIIGTAMQGRYVYCLKLKADGMIDKLQWEDYRPNASAATWPMESTVQIYTEPVNDILGFQQAKIAGKGTNAQAYAVYLIDNKLVFRSFKGIVVSEQTMPDNKIVTAMPMQYGNQYNVSQYFHLGFADGTTAQYSLTEVNSPWARDDLAWYGFRTGVVEPIRYIGWTQIKGQQYMRFQTDTSIALWTITRFPNIAWKLVWSSRIGSGVNYTGNGKTTQSLPLNAKITADSTIAAGKLYVPINIQPPSGALQCADGDAYVYIFNLEDGSAGTVTLGVGETSSQITGKLQIGTGDASKPTVYFSNGTEPRLAFGAAKNNLNSAQAGKIVKLATPRSLGLRGVRVVGPK
jgi:hypothetical protein